MFQQTRKANNIYSLALSLILCSAFVLMQSCQKDDLILDDGTSDGSSTSKDTTITGSVLIKYAGTTATVTNPYEGAGVNVKVSNGQVVVTSTTTTVEVDYVLSGEATNGSFKLYSENRFGIVLNGVSITSANGPAINIQSGKKATVTLLSGTSNRLVDGSSYASSSEDQKATFFSEGQLAFGGTGTLAVVGKYKHGIASDDYIYITEGNITVESAASDGIHANNYFKMDAGTLKVNASNDGIETEAGYIDIIGGTITVNSIEDGLNAGYDGTDSSIESYVQISGGQVTVSTSDDGIKSDALVTIKAGTVVVSKSSEGIEAPLITLAGGNVSVISSDDCVNTSAGSGGERSDGSLLTISGGTIALNSSGGDPLDGNGNIVMTGGTVIVQGPPSSPEVAIDVNGTFNISGGTLIASGPNAGNMIEATSTTSTQYTALVKINGNLAANTLFNIQDADGNSLVTFAPARTAYYFVFSSAALKSGSTYKVYTGGSVSGATNTNGLSSGGSYSGGTLKGSFTVSNKLTTVTL